MTNILHNIYRKFTDILNVSNWQVLSHNNEYVNIKTINKTIPYKVYKLILSNNNVLTCADTHVIIEYQTYNEIFAKDSYHKFIYTDDGYAQVINVIEYDIYQSMYDLELDSSSNHLYYTNGILSHNTTTYTIYLLWLTNFFPEKKVMLLANKLDTALEILSRIRLAYEYLPPFLKASVLTWNKGEIVFGNMSTIKGFATASDAARGFSANVVVSDEFAFVPNNVASKVFESIYPVISSSKNSQFIIVSTPNGADPKNLYYSIWSQANSKNTNTNAQGWKAFRFDWWDVPGRDEQWKLNTIASIGQQRFSQEFGNEFIVTSSIKKLITDDIIEQYRIKLSEYKTRGFKPKIQKIISADESELFEFEMWHEFQPYKTYLAGADIAEGISGDSSVLYIFDVTDLGNIIMCARFSSNSTSLVQFAYVANKILALYNNPPLAAERNGVSAGMLDSLRITYGYQNIISENKKNEPGIYSHVSVKGKACLWARDMMTTSCFGFTIYDKDLLDEFSIFVKKDTQSMHNVYHALPGKDSHDDHVMAFIWALYALHNDRVQKIFTVCETVTTQLNQVYAKILQPLNAYSEESINIIVKDPMYRDFLEYQQELNERGLQLLAQEKHDEKHDLFVYHNQHDNYFDDDDGNSWNNTPLNWNMQSSNNLMANSQKPIIQLGKSFGAARPQFFVF